MKPFKIFILQILHNIITIASKIYLYSNSKPTSVLFRPLFRHT